jgi:TonB-linked SusC/RagA family outer membrane protein
MKITAIFLLTASLAVSARTNSQTITLKVKDASLDKVFAEVKKQTGYSFVYKTEILEKAKTVDLNVVNAPLKQVLDLCFKDQPLSYRIFDKIIAVKEKEPGATDQDAVIFANPPPIDIKGRVTNENGDPVIASVTVKGTQKGAATNENGEFELKGVDENAVLMISGVTIETFEVKVNNKNSFAITAKTKVAGLQEVIVRKGYYDEKRGTTTGNISTVTAKEIEKQPVSNPLLALQGRIPGMEITQATGMPGTGVAVKIRGRNSILNGNNPLFIIDGVPYPADKLIDISTGLQGYSNETAGNPFSYINPADIESIDVLKDADATAIYGSRGANGVVLITTKKGKQGKMRIDINMQTGFGKVPNKIKMLNTRQYLDMRYEAFKNDGAVPNPNVDYDLVLWDTTRYTDWQKELIGGSALYHDVQIGISGGNENIQYRIGTGYHKETTVFPGDLNDQKASVHFNINSTSLDKKFRITFSGVYTTDNNQLGGRDLTEQAILLAPNAPSIYNPDGSINWAPNASGVSTWPNSNPAGSSLLTYQSKTYNLLSNTILSYQITPHLELKTNMGYTNMQSDDIVTRPHAAIDPYTWSYTERRSRFANNSIKSWIIEPQLNYSRKIYKGIFSILLGTTVQQRESIGESVLATGFTSDLLIKDIRSAAKLTVDPFSSGVNSLYKYNAAFGRLNYNIEDKYILNLTARRDGTSRFGPDNRFHNFGAVGAGWVFSKEKFFEKNAFFLSFGKLRVSYGSTGSDQVGDYTYLDLYNSLGVGNPYQGTVGTQPDRLYTPDLAWEETRKLEAGMELGFFNDRIIASASFYRNHSGNQLMNYTLPSITGFISITKNLDALVQNKGCELELRTNNLDKKNIRWSTAINLTINKNKLLYVADGVSDFFKRKVGYPLTSIFVYKYLGVDFITGLYEVADQHGSATSTPDPVMDATVPIDLAPKFYGGVSNTINYKSVQLDFLFQFVKKPKGSLNNFNDIPGFIGSFSGSNQPVEVLGRWQGPGDISDIQRFSQNSSTLTARANFLNSEGAYGDVSYVRLKNVSLSWQLPKTWKRKIHLQNARIYAQGQNLLTITKYKGIDPETGFLRLPPLKVITLGIQIDF